MLPDEEGFLYPVVDSAKCVDCGLCDKVCPVKQQPRHSGGKPISYVVRAKEKTILENSTSGGFITPLLRHVLENNGVICAASYDNDFSIKHILVERTESADLELKKIRGSKYVQSDLSGIFKEIKGYLSQNRQVCFVGTTCQVAGLKAFLAEEYENLICVDLVCHGVPSPKLWTKYLHHQKEKYGAEISMIAFRNKTYGYHSGTMRIAFSNGKIYYGSARVDYMLKCFFSEISSRPICYHCPFKQLSRCSDFSLYDCWHAEKLVAGLSDDDRGYTNVLLHSTKSTDILKKLESEYEIYPVDTQLAVSLDGIMVTRSAVAHKRRNEFYRNIDKRSLDEHVQEFIPITLKDHIVEKSKGVFFRLGIYKPIKKLLKGKRKKR